MKQYMVLSMLFGTAIASDTSEKNPYEQTLRKEFDDGWIRRTGLIDFSRYSKELEVTTMPVSSQSKKEVVSKYRVKSSRKAKRVSVLRLVNLYSSKAKASD